MKSSASFPVVLSLVLSLLLTMGCRKKNLNYRCKLNGVPGLFRNRSNLPLNKEEQKCGVVVIIVIVVIVIITTTIIIIFFTIITPRPIITDMEEFLPTYREYFVFYSWGGDQGDRTTVGVTEQRQGYHEPSAQQCLAGTHFLPNKE